MKPSSHNSKRGWILEGTRLQSWEGTDACLSLSPGIKTVGREAFRGRETLRSIRLPESLLVIEDFAFADCPNLQPPHLPLSLQSIGRYAFSCSLGSGSALSPQDATLTLPQGIQAVGDGAFWGCCELVAFDGSLPVNLGRLLCDPDKESGHWADSLRFKPHRLVIRSPDTQEDLYVLWMASKEEHRSYLDQIMDLPHGRHEEVLGRYDRLFSTMSSPRDKTMVAAHRLLYPHLLDPGSQEVYAAWLARQPAEALTGLTAPRRLALLAYLQEQDLLNRRTVEALLTRATRLQDTRCVAWLLRRGATLPAAPSDDLYL